ncbi:hypothetical protein [Phascolarctobacterium succinatutens]|uniref:hypothetical protein n=1 Tax=Phascolarctobacterium succinatutens TaxID=626940 RepID=UPI0026EE8E4E|nr:hypothetical protein [Phascolarctobacterium succinatutens]
MKMNLKKILIAGTVLTALCANAFAAEEAQAPQPTMKERVAAILHHDDERPCPPQGEFRGRHHRGPRLTDEQRAERQKLRENWKSMTPEQREQAIAKIRKERQEAHDKSAKESMKKLTPAQKAEVEQFIKEEQAQRTERKARLEKMTPEQREAVRANRPLPQKPPKGFATHHKGEFRGYGPHNGPHHPGEFPPPAPQTAQD